MARLLGQIHGQARSDSSAHALALRSLLDGPIRPPPPMACVFCAKDHNAARRLFSGETNVFICDECVCDEVGFLQLAYEAAGIPG